MMRRTIAFARRQDNVGLQPDGTYKVWMMIGRDSLLKARLWAVVACLAGSLALGGCSETAEPQTTAPAADAEDFPNLATVPGEVPAATSRAERERIIEGLKADKANAEYTGDVFGDQAASVAPAEPPPPAPPPKPEDTAESSAEEAAAAESAPAPAPEPESVPEAAPVESVETTEVPVVEEPESAPEAEESAVAVDPSTIEAPSEPAEPDLAATGAPAGTPIGIVYFDTNSASLSSEAEDVLREIARVHQESGRNLRIVGHASGGVDQPEANMKMSMKRAAAVAEGLASLGLAQESLEVEALGDTAPAADESTPEGEAANRRTEIFFQ